jgi:hypothetical protein
MSKEKQLEIDNAVIAMSHGNDDQAVYGLTYGEVQMFLCGWFRSSKVAIETMKQFEKYMEGQTCLTKIGTKERVIFAHDLATFLKGLPVTD